jgi:hypothetical protein
MPDLIWPRPVARLANGPVLRFTPAEWTVFTVGVRNASSTDPRRVAPGDRLRPPGVRVCVRASVIATPVPLAEGSERVRSTQTIA